MMVGTANDTKSEPASTSNRITAFTRPTRATWTRSSRGSPRPSKRRAMWSASGRHRSTMRSRWRWNCAEPSGRPSSSRNMSATSAYSEFDRDDEPCDDDGVTAVSSLASSSSRSRRPVRPRRPARSGRSRTSSVSELRTCQLKLPGASMSVLLQVVEASTTTSLSRGSTTTTSVESGTAERISRVQASSTASRRSATASKSRSSNVPTAATRVRSTAKFSSLAATRSSTDRSRAGARCSDCRRPPSDLPAMSKRDYPRTIPS